MVQTLPRVALVQPGALVDGEHSRVATLSICFTRWVCFVFLLSDACGWVKWIQIAMPCPSDRTYYSPCPLGRNRTSIMLCRWLGTALKGWRGARLQWEAGESVWMFSQMWWVTQVWFAGEALQPSVQHLRQHFSPGSWAFSGPLHWCPPK